MFIREIKSHINYFVNLHDFSVGCGVLQKRIFKHKVCTVKC